MPARISDLRGRLAVPAGVEVLARGGHLVIRAMTPVPGLCRGLPLHPDEKDDPYVFRLDLSELGSATHGGRGVSGRPATRPAAAIGSEDVAQLASSARDCVPRARFCGVDVDALAGVGGVVEGLLRQRQVAHLDERHAEERKAAADDLLSRLDR